MKILQYAWIAQSSQKVQKEKRNTENIKLITKKRRTNEQRDAFQAIPYPTPLFAQNLNPPPLVAIPQSPSIVFDKTVLLEKPLQIPPHTHPIHLQNTQMIVPSVQVCHLVEKLYMIVVFLNA